jgi:MoaA/NifB/PqqE/SkfB family radical SAM enzyme
MSNHLTKLYIEPTTACNLDCAMCVRRVWNEPMGQMALETFADLMDQIRDFPTPPVIHLSGYAEPMCHADFLEMVRLAKATGAEVELTTNAMLLDEAKATALVELGLDRLTVSIDGVAPDRYADIRVDGDLNDVIANVERLHRLVLRHRGRRGRPHIGIAFVAMRSNVDELGKLPLLANRLHARWIQVSNIVPHSPEMEAEILYGQALRAPAYRASTWAPALNLPKFDFDADTLPSLRDVYNSTASISLLGTSLSSYGDRCRFAHEGFAAVRWDGEVSPCLSLLHDHPEYIHGRRKQITHHSFGNIRTTPLQDIWHSAAFTAFRDQLCAWDFSPCTTCGGCERFPANYEDCTGNGFPTCGGCLWAQGFVQCP